MGGIVSGRRAQLTAQTTVDQCLGLDVRLLARQGALRHGAVSRIDWSTGGEARAAIRTLAAGKTLTLDYQFTPDGERPRAQRQTVGIDHTNCHYGGQRPWFCCPHCHRRVASLYCRLRFFLCRHCHGLHYRSQDESETDRAYRKLWNIRARLGYRPGVGILRKPKGMHQTTFQRLRAEEREALGAVEAGMKRLFKRYRP